MTTAIVMGTIGTFPVGGVAWDYGQYALGLERLGVDVFYLEDTGLYPYDPELPGYTDDPSYAVSFLQRSLRSLSATLGERWHLRTEDDRRFGLSAGELGDVIESAELLLNVSGVGLLRDEYLRIPHKVYVDTDPGLNHYDKFPRWDREREREGCFGFRAHDHFFTFAERIGADDVPLPSFDLDWRPTRHPVVADMWQSAPRGTAWTTVMSWNNYAEPLVHEGREYGAKEREFPKIEALPGLCRVPLEIAVGGVDPPVDRWIELGWSVVDGHETTGTADDYRSYILGSRGELSVAKNVYVATGSGWFSGRSACYLAAGKPVVLQDTGWPEILPSGDGLVAFGDLDGARSALETVEADYDHHCRAAREIALTYFDAEVVLGKLLTDVGVQ